MEPFAPVRDDRPSSATETSGNPPLTSVHPRFNEEANASGVSWPSVIGGAFVAAALSLILLALGAGLGLSSISPWANVGLSASTVSTAAIIWLILIQMIASAIGGYLTGRLRTKWATVHTDEVFFRDTANGLLMWAVGMVVTTVFLTTAATVMVGGASAGAAASAVEAGDRSPAQSGGYFVDSLFRSDHPIPDSNAASTSLEAGRILANGLSQPDIPTADKTYLARLVAARTGLSQADADKRVNDVVTGARQAADTARKASAHLLLWIFLTLLIGAFCASLFATFGGRIRDQVKVI
jgi:hypothetical protein